MPPLPSNSLVTLSLTLPDRKNLQPRKSISGFSGSLASECASPASDDADDATATWGEDNTFFAAVAEDISIVADVNSSFLETLKRVDTSGAGNADTVEMLVDATMVVGVMVSFEVGGAESDETTEIGAGGSRVTPAAVAAAAGDGVIVSDDGFEIAVATGGGGSGGAGAAILACVAGMLPSMLASEEAVAALAALCPCPLSSDGIAGGLEVTPNENSFAGVGGGGREGGVARDSDWG